MLGREDTNDAAADSGGKRKPTTSYKHWSGVYLSDNIRVHMTPQHPINFFEYRTLKKRSAITSIKLREFSKQLVIGAFVEKLSTIIWCKRMITIDKAIVEEIAQELMLPAVRENESNDGDDPEGLSPSDFGINIFFPQYAVADDWSKVVSCYTITNQNPVQLAHVVSLLSVGHLFCQISKVC